MRRRRADLSVLRPDREFAGRARGATRPGRSHGLGYRPPRPVRRRPSVGPGQCQNAARGGLGVSDPVRESVAREFRAILTEIARGKRKGTIGPVTFRPRQGMSGGASPRQQIWTGGTHRNRRVKSGHGLGRWRRFPPTAGDGVGRPRGLATCRAASPGQSRRWLRAVLSIRPVAPAPRRRAGPARVSQRRSLAPQGFDDLRIIAEGLQRRPDAVCLAFEPSISPWSATR